MEQIEIDKDPRNVTGKFIRFYLTNFLTIEPAEGEDDEVTGILNELFFRFINHFTDDELKAMWLEGADAIDSRTRS